MEKPRYLSNVIALYDSQIEDLCHSRGRMRDLRHLFTPDLRFGAAHCICVSSSALLRIARQDISDIPVFADTLYEFCLTGQEAFLECDHLDFTNAFPFSHDPQVEILGFLIVPSSDGLLLQLVSLQQNNNLHVAPYALFLSAAQIRALKSCKSAAEMGWHAASAMTEHYWNEACRQRSKAVEQSSQQILIASLMSLTALRMLALSIEASSINPDAHLHPLQVAHGQPAIFSLQA